MKKYETGGFIPGGALIAEIEVVRETDLTVFVMERRFGEPKEVRKNKRSNWKNIHDTWEAAHKFLIDQQQMEVDSLRRQLERENGTLGQIKGIKKPEAA